ncbi:hypothetical protein ACHAXT_008124 [Thalassiosira profunda]
MADPDAPPSMPRSLVDDADCGGCGPGTCVEPTEGNDNVEANTLGAIPSCDCKGTGFIGEHCEIPCARDCQNGGKCLPADAGAGRPGETCSCTKAVVAGNPYAGLNCEYGATKSCNTLGSGSKHSFCTNGGECADIVGDNELHYDCICEGGFEGPHCEYLTGTMPASVAAARAGGAQEVQSTSDIVVWTMVAAVALLIGILLVAFGVRTRRRRAEEKRMEQEVREATEELSLKPTDDDPEKEII